MAYNKKTEELVERTSLFAENVIELCQKIVQTNISRPIISQVIRSAGSIGANYMEAINASSKKDFTNKIYIAKKESQETKHWLRLLIKCNPDSKEEIDKLDTEVQEFIMIFQKITNTLNGK